jgi:hypothetical protein
MAARKAADIGKRASPGRESAPTAQAGQGGAKHVSPVEGHPKGRTPLHWGEERGART